MAAKIPAKRAGNNPFRSPEENFEWASRVRVTDLQLFSCASSAAVGAGVTSLLHRATLAMKLLVLLLAVLAVHARPVKNGGGNNNNNQVDCSANKRKKKKRRERKNNEKNDDR